MELVVDKLIDFSGGKDEELRDISGLGVFSMSIYHMQLSTSEWIVPAQH